jgi:hypothetical protein
MAVSWVGTENKVQIFIARKLRYDCLPKEYPCGLKPLRGYAQCDIVASTNDWLGVL